MAKLIGFISGRVMAKLAEATSSGAYGQFTGSNRQTETITIPVYVGEPANDNLEVQKKLTAHLVAQQQLQKLYVELTNGDAVGEQWEDGEYSHKGYLITNDQLERMRELVGYVGGKQ